MEKSLYEAAIAGNVASLLKLLSDDPLLLDICAVGPHGRSPLHVASLLGHVDFVNEILSRRPDLASELDSQGSSPLHLAAAKGHLTIVKRLLVASPEMCFSRDKFGRNPVHVSAIKGQVEVLKEMVRVRPGAALERMGNGDTILHLCVRNNRLEYLKVLVGENLGNEELIDSKNDDGDTILHLAAADQQSETVNFLIKSTKMDSSSANRKGLTALEVLARANVESPLKEWGHHFREKPREDWFEKMRSALMVVAILTATMAFQVGVNPPGGVWQETSEEKDGSVSHYAGYSIMAYTDPFAYSEILFYNTVSFIASLSIILLLISGLSLRRRLVVWVLMLIMWVAIICNAFTYVYSISAFTPIQILEITSLYILFLFPVATTPYLFLLSMRIVVLVWSALMGLLLVVHTVRLVIRLVRKAMNKWSTKPSSTVSTGGARV